jgi:hypothetical protein
MYIGFFVGVTGITIVVAGIAITAISNWQFRTRLKLNYPEIHSKMFPKGSIGWTGGKELEKSIYDSEDTKLIKLYKTSNMAPAIAFICFAVSVGFIILISKLSK